MCIKLKDDLRRFMHWGPITLLTLTLIVTWTVIHMNSMWWAPGSSLESVLNYALIWIQTFGTLYNFIRSLMVGPGFVPLKWHPQLTKDKMFLQFCTRCNGYKAPRSHHCRRCDRCVMKMDHHCPWINTCVGWSNQDSFVYFLLFFMSGSIHGGIIIVSAVIQGIKKRWLIRYGLRHMATVHLTQTNLLACVFSLGVIMGTVLASIKLLYMQMKSILKNQTEIENWIVKKAAFRRNAYPRKGIKPFVYPYNLGWKTNMREVFFSTGDGISWPVLPDCNEYSLTCEQLQQKKDKRARTRVFRCIRPATGHWVPIFSQGLWVSLQIPCTDDPRIALKPDDIIHVTRIQEYWLYGEIMISEKQKEKIRARNGAIRGWFPSCCAIEICEDSDSENDLAGGEPVKEQDTAAIESVETDQEIIDFMRDFSCNDGKKAKRPHIE